MFKPWFKLAPETDELLTIDLLRFLASFAIILFHFARFSRGGLSVALGHVDSFALAVDLFLIISGFVISYVYEGRLATIRDYGGFLRRRIARLAPLHWLTLSFFVCLGLLAASGRAHTDHPENYDWRCLGPNFLALHAFPNFLIPRWLGSCQGLSFNFVSWSISAEMGMYLIAPVLLALARRSAIGVLALSLAAMAALSVLPLYVPGMPHDPWYSWRTQFGVLRALPDFAFGVALFAFRRMLGRMPVPRVLLSASLLAFLVGAGFEWPAPLLLLFLYLAAACGVASDMKPSPRDWISRLGVGGQLTYSLYMIHPVMLTLLLSLVGQHLLRLDGTLANLWLVAVLVLTVGVSYLSFKLVETPARRFLSGSARSKASKIARSRASGGERGAAADQADLAPVKPWDGGS